jgi:hypothetical protein
MQEQDTIVFLKMAAIELRKIAEEAPEVANRLLHIVHQIEAETANLERRGSGAVAAD